MTLYYPVNKGIVIVVREYADYGNKHGFNG